MQDLGLGHEPVRLFLYNEFSVDLTLTYIFTPFAVLSIYAQLERCQHLSSKRPGISVRMDGSFSAASSCRSVFPVWWREGSSPSRWRSVISSPRFSSEGRDSVMISNVVINLLGVAFDWPLAAAIGLVIITLGLLLISASGWLEEKTQTRF